MDHFTNFLENLGELRDMPLNLKELKNEFKLPNKNFPRLSKMVHYFRTEFTTRTRNESRTKWHNYDKQLLFWVVCKFCHLNSKYVVASLAKKGQRSLDDNDFLSISSILGIDTKIIKNKWLVMVKPQVKNSPWSQEEDIILRSLIDPQQYAHNWTQVATQLAELTHNCSFRNAKQIRERWNNYLNPTLKKCEWEESEDVVLLESVIFHGKKWSQISQIMGCRTESQVKNRYNSISSRLKKAYGEHYSEETLAKMEINNLKGLSSSPLIPILQSPIHRGTASSPHQIFHSFEKPQSKDQFQSFGDHHTSLRNHYQLNNQQPGWDFIKKGEQVSHETFQARQALQYNSHDSSIITTTNSRANSSSNTSNTEEQQVCSHSYSNYSSPQFSDSIYYQDQYYLAQLDATGIQNKNFHHQTQPIIHQQQAQQRENHQQSEDNLSQHHPQSSKQFLGLAKNEEGGDYKLLPTQLEQKFELPSLNQLPDGQIYSTSGVNSLEIPLDNQNEVQIVPIKHFPPPSSLQQQHPQQYVFQTIEPSWLVQQQQPAPYLPSTLPMNNFSLYQGYYPTATTNQLNLPSTEFNFSNQFFDDQAMLSDGNLLASQQPIERSSAFNSVQPSVNMSVAAKMTHQSSQDAQIFFAK